MTFTIKLCSSVPSLVESGSDSDLSTSLGGLMVIQDIQVGFLVALMPFMSGSDSGWLLWALQLLQVIFGFPLLLLLTRGLTSRLLGMFYRSVVSEQAGGIHLYLSHGWIHACELEDLVCSYLHNSFLHTHECQPLLLIFTHTRHKYPQ